MFNFGRNTNDIALFALVGLGLYSQCSQLNLANNTTMLLLFFFLFIEHEEIQELKNDVHHIDECGCNFRRIRFDNDRDCRDHCHHCHDNCHRFHHQRSGDFESRFTEREHRCFT